MQHGIVGHLWIERPICPPPHILSIDKKEKPNIALNLGRAVTQIQGQSHFLSLALVLKYGPSMFVHL